MTGTYSCALDAVPDDARCSGRPRRSFARSTPAFDQRVCLRDCSSRLGCDGVEYRLYSTTCRDTFFTKTLLVALCVM